MLKLNLTPKAAYGSVELDGRDISHHVRSVVVRAVVGEITEATIEYSGAVVVQGELGEIRLEQAPHYVKCEDCQRTIGGESRPAAITVAK